MRPGAIVLELKGIITPAVTRTEAANQDARFLNLALTARSTESGEPGVETTFGLRLSPRPPVRFHTLVSSAAISVASKPNKATSAQVTAGNQRVCRQGAQLKDPRS
jgi:hypothetical protein